MKELTDKQLQLLEVAERLFSKKGFDGTSVRDIAEEAGVNTAMISYYFGSKEKLMEAIFELRAITVRAKIENLLKDDSISPLDKMYVLIDDYVERFFQRQQFHKIMICEQVINKNPSIINMVYKLKAGTTATINELIKDGQKKGVFKKNIDVILLMNTMMGTLTQMLISQQFYRDFNNLNAGTEIEFQKSFKKKLNAHIKTLFKALLTYEA